MPSYLACCCRACCNKEVGTGAGAEGSAAFVALEGTPQLYAEALSRPLKDPALAAMCCHALADAVSRAQVQCCPCPRLIPLGGQETRYCTVSLLLYNEHEYAFMCSTPCQPGDCMTKLCRLATGFSWHQLHRLPGFASTDRMCRACAREACSRSWVKLRLCWNGPGIATSWHVCSSAWRSQPAPVQVTERAPCSNHYSLLQTDIIVIGFEGVWTQAAGS